MMHTSPIEQTQCIPISNKLRLKMTQSSDWVKALPWYEDSETLYFIEGVRIGSYDLTRLTEVYRRRSAKSPLYFIEIYEGEWQAIGDVTFSEEAVSILIGLKTYRNKGIGKEVLKMLILRGRNLGMPYLRVPEIYHYNLKAKALFESLGFKRVSQNYRGSAYEYHYP